MIFGLCLLPLLVLLVLIVWPISAGRLLTRRAACPARTYEEALARLDAVAAGEDGQVLHPACSTRLWGHGRQTEQAALLLHGYSNCPEQLAGLADQLHALGWNVLAPRMPLHGLADRLTNELGGLTAEALAGWAEDSLDIACGLGERVSVFGFSAGGMAALWLAQTRPQAEQVVTLSAFLGIRIIPRWLQRPFIHLFLRLPNRNLWWDPARKAASPYSVEFAYPRFSLRDLAQALRLGAVLEGLAGRQAPAARQVVLMVNRSDPGVSNTRILHLAETWQRCGAQVVVDHFQATQEYLHDVLTPGTPGAPVEQMVARVRAWLAAPAGGEPSAPRAEQSSGRQAPPAGG